MVYEHQLEDSGKIFDLPGVHVVMRACSNLDLVINSNKGRLIFKSSEPVLSEGGVPWFVRGSLSWRGDVCAIRVLAVTSVGVVGVKGFLAWGSWWLM